MMAPPAAGADERLAAHGVVAGQVALLADGDPQMSADADGERIAIGVPKEAHEQAEARIAGRGAEHRLRPRFVDGEGYAGLDEQAIEERGRHVEMHHELMLDEL